jgi:hypothetical protein
MTPRELLDSAKKRFPVMYLSEPIQDDLLEEALDTYQRIAAPFKEITTAGVDTVIDLPADFLSVVVCVDAFGRWHKVLVGETALQVCTNVKSEAPFTIHYFVDLATMDIEAGTIPADCVPLLRKYLRILLNIPNTKRHREVMAATGIQVDLPSSEELENDKTAAEQEMEDAQAIIPMVTT